MRGFSEFIARLKAWQVFLLLVVPMFASQFYLMSRMHLPSAQDRPPSLEDFDALWVKTTQFSILLMVLLFVWVLSIGLAANRRVGKELRPDSTWVVRGVIFAIVYMTATPLFFPRPGMSGDIGHLVFLVFPFHLLAMIGIFYGLGFAAKNILMAEQQSAARFSDYSGLFFLIWFFPVGVWFVQPRVNRLVEREE